MASIDDLRELLINRIYESLSVRTLYSDPLNSKELYNFAKAFNELCPIGTELCSFDVISEEDFAKKQEPGEIEKKTMAQAFLEVVPGCYKKNSCGIEYPDICLDHLLYGGGVIRCVSEPDGNLACARCWQRPYNGEFEVK